MATPAERQALLFFAAIASLGIGVNAWRAVRGADRVVEGSPSDLAAQIARVDSAVTASPSRDAGRAALRKRNAERAAKKQQSTAPPRTEAPSTVYRPPPTATLIDVDVAPAASIDSLPRIGPALSKRIIANRDSFGAFGSLEGLQRVRGVGPAMVKALRDRVTFSGVVRPDAPTAQTKGKRRAKANPP